VTRATKADGIDFVFDRAMDRAIAEDAAIAERRRRALMCEACPLPATQRVHGARLCDRDARESRRLGRVRQ
jgi:hypothetical protein